MRKVAYAQRTVAAQAGAKVINPRIFATVLPRIPRLSDSVRLWGRNNGGNQMINHVPALAAAALLAAGFPR
jgi:hypothetical protein